MISDLTLAKLSAAAYAPLGFSAINDLGLIPLWQGGPPECGVLLARARDGETAVIFRGTRYPQEFLADAEAMQLMDGPGGVKVPRGFFSPLAAIWPALAAIIAGQPIVFGGHSLGGSRAAEGQMLVPTARVVTFASPAAFNGPYTATQTRYVFDRDPIPDLPPFAHHAAPMTWLRTGKPPAVVEHRGGLDFDIADHAIDRYVAALEEGALVAA